MRTMELRDLNDEAELMSTAVDGWCNLMKINDNGYETKI